MILSALFLCLFSTWGFADEKAESATFRIGYFELAPHIVSAPDGSLHGPALDYMQDVLKRMDNQQYELKGYPVQRAFQMLMMNEIDIVLFAAKTPVTTRKEIIMTDLNLVVMNPSLIVRKDAGIQSPVKPADLLDKDLAYWSGGHVPEFLRHPRFNLVKVSGEKIYQRGFRMVEKQRADGFFHVDGLALNWWLRNKYQGNDLELVAMPVRVEGKSLFSRLSAPIYKARFEKAMKAAQQEQTYRDFFLNYRFKEKWIFD